MSGVISKVHLGVPVVDADGRLVIYAVAHAALTAYVPYAVRPSRDTSIDKSAFITGGGLPGTSAANDGKAVTAAAATLAVPHWVGVPQQAYASGDVAKLVIGGAGKVLTDASAITGGTTFLESTAGDAFATATGAAQTVNTYAFACQDNGSAATVINVQFLAVPVQVQA